MTIEPSQFAQGGADIFWPASRARAATRFVLWAAGAVVLGAATFVVYRHVSLGPGVVGSRLVEISIAVFAAPLPIFALLTAFKAIRWLLLVTWPGPVGIRTRPDSLILQFGPFGTTTLDAARLDIKYPFELSGDFESGGFEAFLPEEHQLANFIPQLSHPAATRNIRTLILSHGRGTESQIASALRPAIERWRAWAAECHKT